jgi:hypothetical protein
MAVLLYAVYVILMLVVFGFRGGNSYGYAGLEKLNDLVQQLQHLTATTAKTVNEQSIRFNAALAPASKVMNAVVDPDPRDPGTAQPKTEKPNDTPKPHE